MDALTFYQTIGCPPLNLPFEESHRRRLCFRNERKLYTRKCDGTGKQIISVYSPDKPFTVYESEYWHGDAWDPMAFGRDYDPSRSFFDQYAELQLAVPRMALLNAQGVNSDYCNMTIGNKNSYMIFGGDFNEDCMYGTLCMHNVSCVDLNYSNNNSYCYELGDSINCYGCQFTFDSKNCSNCYYVSDCIGCTECILCTNLSQKSYCIENVQYTPEEYFEKKKQLLNGTHSQAQTLFEKFNELRANRIVKYSHMINCQNCSGDYLKNSKNCEVCFDTSDSEDLTNVIFASKAKDSNDCTLLGDGTELCFNSLGVLGSYNCKCSFFIIESQDVEYSKFIFSSKNIFGCMGLRHKEFCILNKQYTKDEYEKVRAQIVEDMKARGEWGSYFPPSLSDFEYNETAANDYFPLTQEQALAAGYRWKDDEQKNPQPATYTIPDSIVDVADTVTKEILQCESCLKNYRIVAQELAFYKQWSIALPRICNNCRHTRRMNMRNPRCLWSRECQKCSTPLETSYAPERSEVIYCENCYQQTVY